MDKQKVKVLRYLNGTGGIPAYVEFQDETRDKILKFEHFTARYIPDNDTSVPTDYVITKEELDESFRNQRSTETTKSRTKDNNQFA